MSEGRPVEFSGFGQLGMPKWAKRVWPVEEGLQGRGFWLREEEFAKQHVITNNAVARAREDCISDIEKFIETPDVIKVVIRGYHARLNEIYSSHRKAIRSIKDMYPGVR